MCQQMPSTESHAGPQFHSLRISIFVRRCRWSITAYLATFVLLGQSLGCIADDTPVLQVDPEHAHSIVENADRIRFPATGFQADITIAVSNGGQTVETRKYRVLAKGNDNAVLMITEPAAERGQIMLMKERDLWVFLPEVSQPVRISLAQRLVGQVANGDLVRANFAGDYNARVVRLDVIDGERVYVLELDAVDRSVTYQHVAYWVREKNFWPLKAEFYSISKRLLKTCKYENFQMMAGKMRPTRLTIDDALRQGEQSVLDYVSIRERDLPDKIFTKDYLKKLN
jgi:outer membrane lipoprotein-sorting protein